MIYTLDGTPLNEALAKAALARAIVPHHMRRWHPNYIVSSAGERAYTIGHDKNGDPFRVFRSSPIPCRQDRSRYDGARLRAIRAEKGVGRLQTARQNKAIRGYARVVEQCEYGDLLPDKPFHNALIEHGSQRKAAAALGLSLGAFQRRLVKERACA